MNATSGVGSSSSIGAWQEMAHARVARREPTFAVAEDDASSSSASASTAAAATTADGSSTAATDPVAWLGPPPSTLQFAQQWGGDSDSDSDGDGDLPPTGGVGGGADDLFATIDGNGDGSLDADELQAFVDKISGDGTSTDDATGLGQDLLSGLDGDDDGVPGADDFAIGAPDAGGGMAPAPPMQGAAGGTGGDAGDARDGSSPRDDSTAARLAAQLTARYADFADRLAPGGSSERVSMAA